MNGIQDWLGGMSKQEFVTRFFHKLPHSVASGARDACDLCDWGTVERALADPRVDAMVCRRGQQYEGELPTEAAAIRRLSDQGYTVLIRHAERHDARLAELAAAFARDFGGLVNIHIYATPAEQYGFGWHYDAEEVFILQTVGSKEYSLRKNTVHPWPLVETIPADMKYEREIMPLMRCLLNAGDWLYIPNGYWHMGTARETALSLAIGVLSPSALAIHDFLRGRLAQSILWRQRLPVAGQASPLDRPQRREQLRELLGWLLRDLTATYESEAFLDQLLEHFDGPVEPGHFTS